VWRRRPLPHWQCYACVPPIAGTDERDLDILFGGWFEAEELRAILGAAPVI